MVYAAVRTIVVFDESIVPGYLMPQPLNSEVSAMSMSMAVTRGQNTEGVLGTVVSWRSRPSPQQDMRHSWCGSPGYGGRVREDNAHLVRRGGSCVVHLLILFLFAF